MLNDANTSISDKIAMARDFKQPFKVSLEMIIGPMFAGKSTELLGRRDRQFVSGKRCLYVKYEDDNRYDVSSIATHDK